MSRTDASGGGNRAAVDARSNELRRQIEDTTSDYDKERLQERLAKLAGGVAVIRVGAPSEAEMKSRKEAFDDAIAATQAAMAEGIVPGGGVAEGGGGSDGDAACSLASACTMPADTGKAPR